MRNQMQNQISATLENQPSQNMDFSRSDKCNLLSNQVKFSQIAHDSTKWEPSTQNPCAIFLKFITVCSYIAPKVDCLQMGVNWWKNKEKTVRYIHSCNTILLIVQPEWKGIFRTNCCPALICEWKWLWFIPKEFGQMRWTTRNPT